MRRLPWPSRCPKRAAHHVNGCSASSWLVLRCGFDPSGAEQRASAAMARRIGRCVSGSPARWSGPGDVLALRPVDRPSGTGGPRPRRRGPQHLTGARAHPLQPSDGGSPQAGRGVDGAEGRGSRLVAGVVKVGPPRLLSGGVEMDDGRAFVPCHLHRLHHGYEGWSWHGWDPTRSTTTSSRSCGRDRVRRRGEKRGNGRGAREMRPNARRGVLGKSVSGYVLGADVATARVRVPARRGRGGGPCRCSRGPPPQGYGRATGFGWACGCARLRRTRSAPYGSPRTRCAGRSRCPCPCGRAPWGRCASRPPAPRRAG
jgi:hypothetical protein